MNDIRSVAERLDAARDLRGLQERLDATGALDRSEAHARIGAAMRALAAEVYETFPLVPSPLAAPFARYHSRDGAMHGELKASRGGAIDWAIDSFIASPQHGFCNHHLTLWLGPQVKVPHLAIAVGTIPQLFFFCDLVPRADLWLDEDELDTYHARWNQRFLATAADTRFRPFISKEIYIREAISPVGACLEGEVTAANIDHVLGLATSAVRDWMAWVATAPPVPEAARAPLAARDRRVRETICRRDPANVVAERVLGKSMTDALVRVLAAVDVAGDAS